eukprot:scaffold62004_cov30-Tisochrysis_lutea.AAC.2
MSIFVTNLQPVCHRWSPRACGSWQHFPPTSETAKFLACKRDGTWLHQPFSSAAAVCVRAPSMAR